MSVDLSLAVLKSVVAKLNGDAPLAAIVGDRIYDTVPNDVVYPYMSIPPLDSETIRFKGGFGQTHLVVLDIWSRTTGQTELRTIFGALYNIFETITPGSENTGNHSGLSVVGGTVSICQIINARVINENDKRSIHGIVELSIRTRSN